VWKISWRICSYFILFSETITQKGKTVDTWKRPHAFILKNKRYFLR
jgi:hypothetical protein